MPLHDDVAPHGPATPLAPQWRRLAAAAIDVALLALITNLLAVFQRDLLVSLGHGGRLIGLLLGLAYLGGRNSVLGQGQTLGKRLLGLRTVGADGEPVPFERSLLRSALLLLPLLTSGLPFESESPVVSLVGTGLLSLLSVGLGGTILYLYLFDRQRGQSVHDRIAGTWVVDATLDGPVVRPPLWKGHVAAIGVLLLVPVLAGPTLWWFWSGGFDWDTVLGLRRSLSAHMAPARVDVFQSRFHLPDKEGRITTTRYLRIDVVLPEATNAFEERANEVMRAALPHPFVKEADLVHVTVAYGFDLLFASRYWRKDFARPPAVWEDRLREAAPPEEELDSHQGRAPTLQGSEEPA